MMPQAQRRCCPPTPTPLALTDENLCSNTGPWEAVGPTQNAGGVENEI